VSDSAKKNVATTRPTNEKDAERLSSSDRNLDEIFTIQGIISLVLTL
jgi:hypothetical protein